MTRKKLTFTPTKETAQLLSGLPYVQRSAVINAALLGAAKAREIAIADAFAMCGITLPALETRVLELLAQSPQKQTALNRALKNSVSSRELVEQLLTLEKAGIIERRSEPGKGRFATVWSRKEPAIAD
ncbi:MAG: hypothetical protein K2Y32_00220 [Candidatus Obscuribacterales bacterium]|nr:hypothetical protein [Candidatus Obscuribacterales bacterium]